MVNNMVLGDMSGMHEMLFHNKLLSNTAGQVNLSLRFCECVCAADQPFGVREPVSE